MDQLKTPEQVKADFKRRGISVAQWAAVMGLRRNAVYRVLSGKTIGFRGDHHKAAVLLGIKDGVIDDQEWLKTNGPTPEILANEAANPANREARIV
jgi:gp16 family phage-associated protein